jgi:hypothetical protein
MDEPTAPPTPPDRPPVPRRVPSWLAILLLIALGLGLRLWVIARAEVAARDSIGFIRYALRLEREPWREVVRSAEQPPGYPLVVLLVSWPVRAWTEATTGDTMVRSAQLASALMGVLSIIPMVLLGRELSDRRVGWLAAAVFLCLPAWVRLTSDGVSEATFLFWLAMTLWLGVRALRAPGVGRLFACGLTAGAAYLTRPEGVETVVAIAAVLLGLQVLPARRQPWRRVVPQLAALGCGLLVFVGPYVAVTGHLSNKNTVRFIIGDPAADPDRMLPQYGRTLGGARTPLAVWWHEAHDPAGSRWAWAVTALVKETTQGFVYIGAALSLAGVLVFRIRREGIPGAWLLATLVGMHVLLVCHMASLSGYLSERHTLIIVFAGCFPAAAALLTIGDRLRAVGLARGVPFASVATAVIVAALVAAELPTLAKPLHGNRAGHKAAGRWLAAHATPADAIADPFNWAEFYAGPPLPGPRPARPERLFVVLESSDNQHSRLPHIPDAKAKAKLGELVYQWPEGAPRGQGQVVVFMVPGEMLPRAAADPPAAGGR